MTRPFIDSNLFEINDDLKPELINLGPYRYLSIDNFYKNAEDIYSLFQTSWVQNWKVNEHGKNFHEYYDCRLSFPNRKYGLKNKDKTMLFLKSILRLENHSYFQISSNIFSWILPPTSNFQFQPHQDNSINILVYLDKINSGGTALYEGKPTILQDESLDIKYDKQKDNLKYHVIPSKFNRCVIFDGQIYHGGHIEDHSKYSNGNWRYNTVYFLYEDK
tara:strand:- start:3081 stop:3734 length:654 start_codon:yes stop_codon:yes gene_type:complete